MSEEIIDHKKTVPLDLTKIPFEYKELDPKKRFSGIYACLCRANNKFYLGSTKDFSDRKSGHLSSLRRKEHHSIIFQNTYNKYGVNNFTWFCLEQGIPEEELLTVEQKYLDFYTPYKSSVGLNINAFAIGGGENTAKDYLFYNLKGEEIRGKNLSKFARQNRYHEEHLRDLLLGRKKYYRDMISAVGVTDIQKAVKEGNDNYVKRNYYKVISPSGEIMEGFDRVQFCRKVGLKCEYMTDLLRGDSQVLFGWRKFIEGKHPNRTLTLEELKVLDEENEVERLRNAKEWSFYKGDTLVKTKNAEKYCKENGIKAKELRRVCLGEKMIPYLDYTSANEEIRAKQLKAKYTSVLIKEDGEILKIDNLFEFSRINDIDPDSLYGRIKQNKFHKGYYLINKIRKLSDSELSALIEEKKRILFAPKK